MRTPIMSDEKSQLEYTIKWDGTVFVFTCIY